MGEWGLARVANPGSELKKWRTRRGLTLRALATRVNSDFGHLGKIENGKAKLNRDMARVCDQALDAGGALIHAWHAAQGSIRPAQLPAMPAQLVGRDTELAMLTEGVHRRVSGTSGIAAIDGPAGAGKTALALHWAHRVSDAYVDGQLYADLGGFGPPGSSVPAGVVLEGFLTAMGASSIPGPVAERAALYRSLLAERNVLIVVDNVADIDDVMQLTPASTGCTVVVTSRRALSSLVTRFGATRVTVRPLAETDSIKLVSRIIGEQRADTDATAVVTLTRLCGHLPLALSVAAEQIATHPHRRVADLVDELLEEENRLSAWESTDLHVVFSWSYRDLDDDTRRLFRLLGLHTGPHLSAQAVAALADLPLPRTRRLLHRLAALHLLEITPNQHLQLHHLISAYARHLVATEENDEQRRAAARRLVTWYHSTACEAATHLCPHRSPPTSPPAGVAPLTFTDLTDARAWCITELDNFGPITTLATHYGPPAATEQITTVLADLDLRDPPTTHNRKPRPPIAPTKDH